MNSRLFFCLFNTVQPLKILKLLLSHVFNILLLTLTGSQIGLTDSSHKLTGYRLILCLKVLILTIELLSTQFLETYSVIVHLLPVSMRQMRVFLRCLRLIDIRLYEID